MQRSTSGKCVSNFQLCRRASITTLYCILLEAEKASIKCMTTQAHSEQSGFPFANLKFKLMFQRCLRVVKGALCPNCQWNGVNHTIETKFEERQLLWVNFSPLFYFQNMYSELHVLFVAAIHDMCIQFLKIIEWRQKVCVCVSGISSAICIFWILIMLNFCRDYTVVPTKDTMMTHFISIRKQFQRMKRREKILTHQRWHFALCELRHGSTDWNLERCDVESRHVILAATFVIVVNDVFSHIVIGSRIFDVRFPSSAVHDEYQHEYCVSDRG